MKTFYFIAWFLLIASALASSFVGTFDAFAMVAFSLVALGLIHALALWSVFVNTRDTEAH